MRILLFSVGIALLCLAGIGVGVTIADSGFEVSIADTNEVPDRSVEIENETFTITEFVQRDRGEPFDVTVSAPSADSTYRLRLYTSEMDVLQSKAREGDGTYTFETSESKCPDCEPGTYILFLYNTTGPSEERVLAKPIVISGYDVTMSIPDSATEGETVTADIEVEPTAASGQPAAVEVGIGNGDGEEARYTATHQGGTSYTAEVDLSGMDPTTYKVYAGALGTDTIGDSDEREVVGISESHALTVESQDNGGTGGGTGGGQGGSGSGTVTPTDSQTPTPTATDDGNGSTATPTPTDGPTTPDDSTPTQTDDSNVITPNQPTETEGEPATESDGPAPSLPLVVGSIATAGLWLRQRRT